MTSEERKTLVREIRKKFILHVHEALRQWFQKVPGARPENTVATIAHKDSPVCPEQARELCEKNNQSYVVMCGPRELVAKEILKVPGKGHPLYERTSNLLLQTPAAGYVYVVTFEQHWASISPILWTESAPKADGALPP
jgi:hypothetical protein